MENDQTPTPDSDSIATTKEPTTKIDAQKFELFPKLAIEIRLKIWGYACLVPRNVGLWLEPICGQIKTHDTIAQIESSFEPDENDYVEDSEPKKKTYCPVLFQFRTNLKSPSVLRTCQEARLEALKYYNLEFGCEADFDFKFLNAFVTIPPHIYINWDVDTACFMPLKFNKWLGTGEALKRMSTYLKNTEHVKRIKKVALDQDLVHHLFTELWTLSETIEQITIYWTEVPRSFYGTSGPRQNRQNPHTAFRIDFVPLDKHCSANFKRPDVENALNSARFRLTTLMKHPHRPSVTLLSPKVSHAVMELSEI